MHGPTCICWANLTPFSLQTYGDATVTVTVPAAVDQTQLDVMATRNASTLTLRVVNIGMAPLTTALRFEGCRVAPTTARLLTLAGALTAQVRETPRRLTFSTTIQCLHSQHRAY